MSRDHEGCTPDEQVFAAAHTALRRRAAGDPAGAYDALAGLGDGCGCAVGRAMEVWCTMLLDHIGAPYGSPRPMFWTGPDGRTITDVDQLPPPVAWASRMLQAWLASDKDTWTALLAVPQDPLAVTVHVLALLDLCATGLSHPPADSVRRA